MSEQPAELSGSSRSLPAGVQRVGTPDQDEQVEVTITLRGPSLPDTDGPVTQLDPASYAASYGADPADAAKVEEELRSRGLQVYDVSLADRSMHARGTIAQLNAAFGVDLGLYESQQHGTFRGRAGKITIPAPLDGIVTGVFGLDDRRVAHRRGTPAQPSDAGAYAAGLRGAVPVPAGQRGRPGRRHRGVRRRLLPRRRPGLLPEIRAACADRDDRSPWAAPRS